LFYLVTHLIWSFRGELLNVVFTSFVLVFIKFVHRSTSRVFKHENEKLNVSVIYSLRRLQRRCWLSISTALRLIPAQADKSTDARTVHHMDTSVYFLTVQLVLKLHYDEVSVVYKWISETCILINPSLDLNSELCIKNKFST